MSLVVSARIKALIAHPGTQYAPRLAAELAQRGMLYRYWTSLGFSGGVRTTLWTKALPAAVRRLVASRTIPAVHPHQLRTAPLLEIIATTRLRAGCEPEATMHARNTAFQNRIPEAELTNADAVIGFDTSSWILAERCAAIRKTFVLDQSIGHPAAKEDVYQKLRQRFPEWNKGFIQKQLGLIAKEDSEHALAKHIVVASGFSQQTLISNGVPKDKITVIPYGVDLDQFKLDREPRKCERVRFLFVGLVNARKGIPLLLAAWRRLERRDAELWLVGSVSDTVRRLIPDLPGLKILGAKPHAELPAIFRQCDVFVFPSFFEGFALVLLEAMASGLPIIASTATAAPELISDPSQGVLVETGNGEMLLAAMQQFIDNNDRREEMSKAARRRAEDFSWSTYGDRWATLLNSLA